MRSALGISAASPRPSPLFARRSCRAMLSTGVSRSLGRSTQFARTKRNTHVRGRPGTAANIAIGSVAPHVRGRAGQPEGWGRQNDRHAGARGRGCGAVVCARWSSTSIRRQTPPPAWAYGTPRRRSTTPSPTSDPAHCMTASSTAVGPTGVATRPSVAPSSPLLASREAQLATDPVGAQDRLRVAMEGLDGQSGFDLVLVDCPPSLGLLTVNGLFAADAALVVTEPGAWATDGVAQILRTVARISDRRRTPLRSAGIAVNRLGRTRDATYWHDQLVAAYPELVHPPCTNAPPWPRPRRSRCRWLRWACVRAPSKAAEESRRCSPE